MPVYSESVLQEQTFHKKTGSTVDEPGRVERAMRGDAEAFGELYLQYLDAIYRYIYFRAGDAEEAEDLTEQVFLKAWEKLAEYQDFGHPFSSWLYRIAHNIVVDHHRRQRPVVSITTAQRESPDSGQTGLLTHVIASEEMNALAAAISKLPDEQQQVLVLRFVEGLNHAEVARIMEKSDGACRMLQHRALAALNELLTGVQR